MSGSSYLGAFLGSREELEVWVRPQVGTWDRGVCTPAIISKHHPHLAYYGLGMYLQLECQYLQRTVPGVGNLMGPFEEALRETFFLVLFRGEEVNPKFRKILGHIVKSGGLGIPVLLLLEEHAYNSYKASCGKLLDSILVVTNLNYICHRVCVSRSSAGVRKEREGKDMEYLGTRKEDVEGI